MKKANLSVAKLLLLILFVGFIGGCKPIMDLIKGKKGKESEVVGIVDTKDDSLVLLNIDGKPAITKAEFDKYLAQMMQANPYFRGVSLDSLPSAIRKQIFDKLREQEVILRWAAKNSLDKEEEFIKSFEEMMQLVKRSLLVQSFEKKIFEGISVSDSDIKKHYEDNKSKFVKEPGGMLISGVKFATDEAATNFYNNVKGKFDQFVELAKKETDGKFKDFDRVVEQDKGFGSDIPSEIKAKAFSLKSFPAIEKVKSKKDFWVIYCSDKKDAQYFNLDEIKPQLESMLKQEKFKDEVEKEIKKIEGEFTIDTNDAFFMEEKTSLPETTKETPETETSSSEVKTVAENTASSVA